VNLNSRLRTLEERLPPPPTPPPDRWFPEWSEERERRWHQAARAVAATMPAALFDQADEERRLYGSVLHPGIWRLFDQLQCLADRTAEGLQPTLALPEAVCAAVMEYSYVEFGDQCERFGLELPIVPDRGALRGGPGGLAALKPIGAAHWFCECPAYGGRVLKGADRWPAA
jgi:hypothetical protein